MWYSLTGPFGYEARKALQARAAAETKLRHSSKTKAVGFKPRKKKESK